MRKDYIAATEPTDHETEFVEKYWTDVWEREGGPQGHIDRIPRKEEYRAMAPYMEKLPPGARLFQSVARGDFPHACATVLQGLGAADGWTGPHTLRHTGAAEDVLQGRDVCTYVNAGDAGDAGSRTSRCAATRRHTW